MTRSDRLGLALALALTCAPALAHGETDEQKAMALFERGRKLAREGRCAEAIPTLLESVRYVEGVGPLLNLGNCYETLGKTASAHRYFVRAQEIASARGDRRQGEAAQRARSLERELPFLVVHVPPALRSPSTELRVDGELWPSSRWDVPIPIDPGDHAIELAGPASKQSETIVVRPKGESIEWSPKSAPMEPPPAPAPHLQAVPTELPPAPDAPRRGTQRTLGLATAGIGGAGVVAGAIAGIVSMAAHASVTSSCLTYPQCPTSARASLEATNERAQTAGTISTIGFVAGGALLAAGALLFFTAPRAKVGSDSAVR